MYVCVCVYFSSILTLLPYVPTHFISRLSKQTTTHIGDKLSRHEALYRFHATHRSSTSGTCDLCAELIQSGAWTPTGPGADGWDDVVCAHTGRFFFFFFFSFSSFFFFLQFTPFFCVCVDCNWHSNAKDITKRKQSRIRHEANLAHHAVHFAEFLAARTPSARTCAVCVDLASRHSWRLPQLDVAVRKQWRLTVGRYKRKRESESGRSSASKRREAVVTGTDELVSGPVVYRKRQVQTKRVPDPRTDGETEVCLCVCVCVCVVIILLLLL
jgi:hypothetical protein